MLRIGPDERHNLLQTRVHCVLSKTTTNLFYNRTTKTMTVDTLIYPLVIMGLTHHWSLADKLLRILPC